MKRRINDILLNMPMERDILVTVERYNDSFTFYNYEKESIILTDEYLIFSKDGKTIFRTRYENITNFKWKPVFQNKNMREIQDGEYMEKRFL